VVCWNADGTEVADTVGGYNGVDAADLVRGLLVWGEHWSETAGRFRLVAVS
jgi:hypothetical protein